MTHAALMKSQATNLSGQRVDGLLDVPIHRLMDDLSAATAASLVPEYVITTPLPPIDLRFYPSHSHHVLDSDSSTEDTLWVDKYRPGRFIELIGNERVARDTMTWVKQWDWCVFGKKRGKKRLRDDDENFNTEDPYHRPQQKVRGGSTKGGLICLTVLRFCYFPALQGLAKQLLPML